MNLRLAAWLNAHPEETIFVSPCLLGVACRYDGKSKSHSEVRAICEDRGVVMLCPEVAGGLPIPRLPAERLGDRVINSAGEDVTAAYQRGAELAKAMIEQNDVQVAILKARSPSCGHQMIYDGQFSQRLILGEGILAEQLRKAGVMVFSEEDV